MGRIPKFLKAKKYVEHVGIDVLVYLVVVLGYLVVDILALTVNSTHHNNKICIVPRNTQFVVQNGQELSKFLVVVNIGNEGVIPSIHLWLSSIICTY
jgi:hypothetical protein